LFIIFWHNLVLRQTFETYRCIPFTVKSFARQSVRPSIRTYMSATNIIESKRLRRNAVTTW